MRASPYRPRVHVLVCANRRASDDALGAGCGERGERVFAAMKRRGGPGAWITKTHCLGLCPKRGCAVAIAPRMQYLVDVEDDDVDALVQLLSAER
jgi:hypothetical protein